LIISENVKDDYGLDELLGKLFKATNFWEKIKQVAHISTFSVIVSFVNQLNQNQIYIFYEKNVLI
jgi:hypothetical protein